MKANVIRGFGPAREVFQIQEIPDPACLENDLLLKVLTTSVNPLDCRIRTKSSIFRNFPLILGFDVCGIVVGKGAKVTGFAIGDKVIGSPTPFRRAANAEFVAIDHRSCTYFGTVSEVVGAALPLVGITAWEALHGRLQVRPGSTVVIHAGAGGVGHIAVQLAKQAGCKVITTASRPESIAFCKDELNADHVLNYKTEPVPEAIKDLTDGQGASLILDTAGGDCFHQCLDYVAPNGHICSILPVAMDTSEGYRALLKNITVSYQFMGGPLQQPGGNRQGKILERLTEMVESGSLVPHVSKLYDWHDLALAHEDIEGGHTMGKIVVRVSAG